MLLIAQIALPLRSEVARRAAVDVFDVSLRLLVPHLRRITSTIPPDLASTPAPDDLPTRRVPRYAGRRCGPDRTDRRPA